MCHFVTFALPAQTDREAAKAILKAFDRPPGDIDHSLGPIVKPNEWYFWPSGTHCDCGTRLAEAQVEEDNKERLIRAGEKKIASLRRKKWSEAKILRAVGSGEAKPQPKDRGDIKMWSGLVEGLLSQKSINYVGVLVHSYRGALNDPFPITRAVARPNDLEEFLINMPEDVLHEIRPN